MYSMMYKDKQWVTNTLIYTSSKSILSIIFNDLKVLKDIRRLACKLLSLLLAKKETLGQRICYPGIGTSIGSSREIVAKTTMPKRTATGTRIVGLTTPRDNDGKGMTL